MKEVKTLTDPKTRFLSKRLSTEVGRIPKVPLSRFNLLVGLLDLPARPFIAFFWFGNSFENIVFQILFENQFITNKQI